MNLHAHTRLLADDNGVIAPSTSFKEKNEKDLDRQQQTRETQEDKESTSDRTSKEGTAVHDTAKASSTLISEDAGTAAQYAGFAIRAATRLLADRLNTESDPLTDDEEDACLASSTNDNDFPGGRSQPSRNITNDPRTNDYMNVTADAEGLSEEELLADADPYSFGNAEQPMG